MNLTEDRYLITLLILLLLLLLLYYSNKVIHMLYVQEPLLRSNCDLSQVIRPQAIQPELEPCFLGYN